MELVVTPKYYIYNFECATMSLLKIQAKSYNIHNIKYRYCPLLYTIYHNTQMHMLYENNLR